MQSVRKAWSAPFCLATQTSPHFASFLAEARPGLEAGLVPEDGQGTATRLQCFPLAAALAALENPTVNLLSLDIEGAEFPVLQTLPWQQVRSPHSCSVLCQ